MKPNPYKYGIVLLTNDPKVKNLDVKDGIYVAIEAPTKTLTKMLDGKIWLESFLDTAKEQLWRRIKEDTNKK